MAAAGEDLALALDLADLADEITMARFGARDLRVDTKVDMTPVSEADTAVEQAIRARLASERPDDAVLGEEYGAQDVPAHGRRWIVDPIDGTMSYVRGVPAWGTLVALEVHGEAVVGVASAPALGRRWWAARGLGAHTRVGEDSSRRIRVSTVADLHHAQACFGGLEDWARAERLENLVALSEQVWRTRGYGDLWQYMLVAEGAAEIASDPDVSVWDLAAPLVIVTEAGGRFTDFGGHQTHTGRSGLATNGLLHEPARALLGDSDGDGDGDDGGPAPS